MSYANLLGINGKIQSQYLPMSTAPASGVQNPMTASLDGGGQSITNLAEITTTSSANLNYITITEGQGAEISLNSIDRSDNDLCFINGNPNASFLKASTTTPQSAGYVRLCGVISTGIITLNLQDATSSSTTLQIPNQYNPATPGAGPFRRGIQAGDVVVLSPIEAFTGTLWHNVAPNNILEIYSTSPSDIGKSMRYAVLEGMF